MKCTCCDRTLNDYEATRRHGITNEFLDICNSCYQSIASQVALPVTDRQDLMHERGIEEEVDNSDDTCYPYFKDYKEL